MDIIANILEIVKDGSKKTRIMYLANLSFDQLKKYLKFLMDKNFLEYNSIEKKYKATNKGLDFLKKYHKFKKIEEKYRKELKPIKKAFMSLGIVKHNSFLHFHIREKYAKKYKKVKKSKK